MSIRFSLGEVSIPGGKRRRYPLGPNARIHWGERHKWNEAWREEVWRAVAGCPQRWSLSLPWEYAIIKLTIYATHRPDDDNATAMVKPIVDSLKGLVIKDDAAEKVRIIVETKKVEHKKEEHVEITVVKS